jgi:hypothetical protein
MARGLQLWSACGWRPLSVGRIKPLPREAGHRDETSKRTQRFTECAAKVKAALRAALQKKTRKCGLLRAEPLSLSVMNARGGHAFASRKFEAPIQSGGKPRALQNEPRPR